MMKRNYLIAGGTEAPAGGQGRRRRPQRPQQGNPRPDRSKRPPRREEKPQARAGRGRGRGKGRGGQPNPVTRPITPQRLGKEVQASTNQKFRPLERRIGEDLRASRKRQQEVGGWWQDYLTQAAQGRTEVQAAYTQAGEDQEQFMMLAGDRDAAQTQALNEEAAASADLRGAQTTSAGGEREAAAGAQRQITAASHGATLATQGAGQYAYLTDKMRIGRGQSIASRQAEGKRTHSIRQDRRDLARERGEYATTYRGDLRDREREYLIQRGVAGLDKRKQRADEREGAQATREEARERREDRRQREIENRQRQEGIDIDREEARDGGRGGRTPSERNAARDGNRNARATTSRLIKQSGVPRSAKEWAELEEAVAKESEVSPAEARLAVRQAKRRIAQRQGNRGTRGAKVPYAP
jgi:hypothetical protein